MPRQHMDFPTMKAIPPTICDGGCGRAVKQYEPHIMLIQEHETTLEMMNKQVAYIPTRYHFDTVSCMVKWLSTPEGKRFSLRLG